MSPWKVSFCVIAVLVFALAGQAEAACDNNVRVQPEDSACLEATHGVKRYVLDNFCRHRIRVKIDIAGGTDRNVDVNAMTGANATRVEGDIDTSFGRSIRDVTCCSDYASCN